jgi:chromate reductase
MNDFTVLGISGSLRKDSYNTAALRAAIELAPAGMTIKTADISQIPVYNDDVRAVGWPASVQTFREQIRQADALLFVTPEYNYSVPGVLKNAIDWASRPPDQPFAGKPAAVMGVSVGALGTARAQYHLRQIGVFLDLRFFNKPEVMIGPSSERFNAEGHLTHQPTREHIGKLLAALQAWAIQLKK